MSKSNRRKFDAEFKSKICVEAIKERQAIEALAKKHKLHPTQINAWKKARVLHPYPVFLNSRAFPVSK